VLALEAGRTLLLERAALIEAANQMAVTVVGVRADG